MLVAMNAPNRHAYDTDILETLSQRIVVGDGAMGTQLQDADLTLDILTLLSDANARGTTVVVATHDQHLLAIHPRRTLVLSGGRAVDR